MPNVGDLGAALLPHAKRSKTDGDASAAVAVDPHAAAAGAAFFDEEVDKVEALLKSGTKIELEEAKNDIEAVLAAGGRASPPRTPRRTDVSTTSSVRRVGRPIPTRASTTRRIPPRCTPSDWTRSSRNRSR